MKAFYYINHRGDMSAKYYLGEENGLFKVLIVSKKTGEIVKEMSAKGIRQATQIADGVERNLNHKEYKVSIKEGA